MRERRSRIPAAVALVVALLAAAVIGRLTAPRADAPPVPRPAPVTEPPGLRATGTVAGVPVGYARMREGAVAAMAAYGRVLADPRVQLDDRRRHAVAAAVGTERYAQSLQDAGAVFAARRAGPVGQALRPGARAVFLAVPIAYRMVSYDDSTAVIESWGVAITASDTGLSPQASWGTTTTTAVWERGDWKVDEVRLAARAHPRRRRCAVGSAGIRRCAKRPAHVSLCAVASACWRSWSRRRPHSASRRRRRPRSPVPVTRLGFRSSPIRLRGHAKRSLALWATLLVI